MAPYTPEGRLPGGKHDPVSHTKPQIALTLIERARAAAISFDAIVADSAYGDNPPFVPTLTERHLPYVLAHSGTTSRGWAPEEVANTFEDAAHELPMRTWQQIVRRFRNGHTELVRSRIDAVPLRTSPAGVGCM